ncbi:Peroxin-3 [Hysterangium stoloniferum]|nr:Peroxin-3 [Hysterangium stoloniferum]
MLDNVRKYFYERRKGLATTAGFLGAVYLAGRYVMERLEEMREQAVQEKTARENLRRRFQQNQQDCTYTILTLLPTLGERILEEMDVESITLTLQLQSKAAKARLQGLASSDINTSSISLNTEQPSVTSSIELSMPIPARHDAAASYSRAGENAQGWVEQFTAESVGSSASDADHAAHDAQHVPGSPSSSSGAHLSDSVTSASVSLISGSDGEPSAHLIESLHSGRSDFGEPQVGVTIDAPPTTTKSKAELWREVKILTFTRTLTILYSTTLLSLLTHIQLNLLGRYKYVQSVLDLEKEEKLKEQQSFQASVSSLFWGDGDLAGVLEGLENDEVTDTLGLFGTGRTGVTERKYLTLSWWLIYVGWRDIGDRVRTAVEEIFDDVSLKAKLDMEDLERLIKAVRQKIEFDAFSSLPDTAEGDGPILPISGRRISFLPSLIPATPERLKDVLVQSGLPYEMTSLDDTPFLQLVDETREFVSSADFGRVLETCLDHATDVLFDGLRRTLFPDTIHGNEVTLEKIRLAGLLPGVARWSHAAVNGTPNELVENLAEIRELAGFSAIIYSSYVDTFR